MAVAGGKFGACALSLDASDEEVTTEKKVKMTTSQQQPQKRGHQVLNTQLLFYAENGDLTEVQRALHQGANVNWSDYYGWRPLHWASDRGHADIVKVLLAAGANKDVINKSGQSSLHKASYNGHSEVVRILLAAGVKKDAVNEQFQSPLHLASKNGHTDVVKILLAAGSNKDVADKDGQTSLHLASENGHGEVAKILLTAGANVLVDQIGQTPLHVASENGHTDIVKLLLAAGINKEVVNRDGKTALNIAHEKGYDEIVHLIERGVTVVDTELKWNIDNFDEEQVFEKPEYGVKLVIPPSSVQESQSIDTTVQILKSGVSLPPNVEPVSCFYKIEASGSFVKPIQLHLQHNVDVTSSDNRRLAFVTSSGSPPYQFEFCDVDDQMFDPNDNSGVLHISHLSKIRTFGIVWKNVVDRFMKSNKSYVMTPFYRQTDEHCWQLKVVITKNIGPFFEKLKTLYNGWIKKDSGSFYFNPDVNTVTLKEYNQYFDITSLKTPQVDKKEVDDCPHDSEAFPLLHVQVKLKPSCSISPLKIEFEGMSKQAFIVITETELLTSRSSNVISKIIPSDELLAREPRKKHLMSELDLIKFQWKLIGEQLEVDNGSLKSIEYNTRYNDTMRLSEVFQVWIDGQTSEVSWRMILDVIRNPPLSNKKLFYDIQKFLSRNEIQILYLSVTDVHQKTFPITPSLEEAKPVPVSPLVELKKSAQRLHQETKDWEQRSNDMIAAANDIASNLKKQMSKLNRDVNEEVIETVLLIKDSEEVVKIANRVCEARKILEQVIETIPAVASQPKK